MTLRGCSTRHIAAATALALMVGASACSSSAGARKDVTITACNAGKNGGHPTAAGRIVNHSSKASIYTVHVKFRDSSGNGVGDGISAVAKVDSGDTAKWDTTDALSAKGPVKCRLESVTRNRVP